MGSNPGNYKNQFEGYAYGVRKNERKKSFEFYAAMYMTLGNTLFKKRIGHSGT